MKSLRWKLNRVRAMSAAETVFRGTRWLAQKYEKHVIQCGVRPRCRTQVRARHPLFGQQNSWLDSWKEVFEVDTLSITTLLEGKIDFFGNTPLSVGNPVAWHREPKTGVISPMSFGKSINYRDDKIVGEVKYIWELGRHQHLVPLAVAYVVTGEHRILSTITKQIEEWIIANPYGKGIHWCSALEVSLRLISWAFVHSLIVLRDGECGLFGAVKEAKLLGNSIYEQTVFVRGYLSRYSSANNHLIGELTGLWVAGQVFDLGPDSNQWMDRIRQELETEAIKQVWDDGVSKEQAIYYHLWVLEYLLLVYLVGERCNIPFSENFHDRIIVMAQFLSDLTPPNGLPPQIGDSDNGFVVRFDPVWPSNPYADVIAAVNATLRNDAVQSDSSISQKAFWYELIVSKNSQKSRDLKRAPSLRAFPRVYKSGGYAILGDDDVRVIFDAGPLGYPSIAAHGHADALSICLSIKDKWWLIDPGTYSYHSQAEWRDYFRGTSAHNTVVIDEMNQSEIGGAFLWNKRAEGSIEKIVSNDLYQKVSGKHDGYKDIGLTHIRQVQYISSKKHLIITDVIDGISEHKMDIYYHFPPTAEIERIEDKQAISFNVNLGEENIYLVFQLDNDITWELICGCTQPIQGWYSKGMDMIEPAPVLKGSFTGVLPKEFVSHIYIKRIDN